MQVTLFFQQCHWIFLEVMVPCCVNSWVSAHDLTLADIFYSHSFSATEEMGTIVIISSILEFLRSPSGAIYYKVS